MYYATLQKKKTQKYDEQIPDQLLDFINITEFSVEKHIF